MGSMNTLALLGDTGISSPEVLMKAGDIKLLGHESLMHKARMIKNAMKGVEVDRENAKEAKKLAAAIRKAADGLEEERKRVKKAYMAPCTEFESKIKEVSSICREAEEAVRKQLKRLDEEDRNRKEEELANIFEEMSSGFWFEEFLSPELFIRPQHLNKSFSVTKFRDDLGRWLRDISDDLAVLKTMVEADKDQYAMAVACYFPTLSLNDAISTVEQLQEMAGMAEDAIEEAKAEDPTYKYVTFKVLKADALDVEELLLNEGIGFEMRLETNDGKA